MSALNKFVTCEVLAWLRGGTIDDVVFFAPQAEDLNTSSSANALAFEICVVDRVVSSWAGVCFVKFLSVRLTDCHSAIKAAPQIPLLAAAGSQRRGNSTRVEPLIDGGITYSVAPPPNASPGRILDVRLWPPTKQIPKAIELAPRARPSEGVLTHAALNKNAQHLQEIANTKPRNTKFGAQGARPSGTAAEAGQSRNPEASSDEEDWFGRENEEQTQSGS